MTSILSILFPILLATAVPRAHDDRAGGAETIPVMLPDTLAADGDTVALALTVDLTGPGISLGSFQGTLRFSTSVLGFVTIDQGDFAGDVYFNTDSAASGVIRFAGASADTTLNRGAFPIAVLTVTVSGIGGEVADVSPEVTELAAAGSLIDMVESTQQVAGHVTVDPGPLPFTLVPDSLGATNGATTDVELRLDLTSTVADPGALEGTLAFDPAVVNVSSVTPGPLLTSVTANLGAQADSGFVRWAALVGDTLPRDVVVVATFSLTSVAPGLSSTSLAATVSDAINAPNFLSLMPFVGTPAGGTWTVTFDGLWGDPSLTWQTDPSATPITAFDALVCLRHTVGLDVGAFDSSRCDVAPAGAVYDGTITSLDALAILSYVVGGDTSGYRVGSLR